MKKLSAIFLFALMLCSLTGCNELNEAKSDLQGELSNFLGETSGLLDDASQFLGEASDLQSQLDEALHGSSSNTSDTTEKTSVENARDFNTYVVSFYNSLISGDINLEDSKELPTELSQKLPSVTDSVAVRTQKAQQFTIAEVITYQGKNTDITNFCFADMGFGSHRQGEILSRSDPELTGHEDSVVELKLTTTLGRLFSNP